MFQYKQQSFPFKTWILAATVMWIALSGAPVEAQGCDAKLDREVAKLDVPATLDPGNCAALAPQEAFRCALATQIWAWLESQGQNPDFDTIFVDLGSAAANGRADDMVFNTQSGTIVLLEGQNAFTIQPPPLTDDNDGDPSKMINVIDTLSLKHSGGEGDVMLIAEGVDIEGNGVYLGSFVLGAGQSISLGVDGAGANPFKKGSAPVTAVKYYGRATKETLVTFETSHRARGLEALLSCSVVFSVVDCNYCAGTCDDPSEHCEPVETSPCWVLWTEPDKCDCV